MEQFLSRFTFGLLMAQVFPGGVFVLTVTGPLLAARRAPKQMSELFWDTGNLWFSSTKSTVVFLFLAGGVGMFLHGISWIVMAWLENYTGAAHKTPVRDSFWHQSRFGNQILIAPIKMLVELVWVTTAPNIDKLAMEESGTHISPQDKPLYDFFQDFCLYFAQFYAHTAYALLFSIPCLIWTWAIIGITWRRSLLIILVYFLTSIFFLISRVQFASLFKAENVLRQRATKLSPCLK
jgi:hypothetical protein